MNLAIGVLPLLLLLGLTSVSQGVVINCDEVKDCHCYRLDNYEVQCPAEPLEQFNISLKVSPVPTGLGAKLTVTCDLGEPSLRWDLVHGLNLSSEHTGFPILQLEMILCPMDEEALSAMTTHLGIDRGRVISFAFLTHGKRNLSQMPSSFLGLFPALEDLALRSNGLTSMPGLSDLPKLKTLNLSDNRIRGFLKVDHFQNNPLLTNIQLIGNKFDGIQDGALPKNTNLISLAGNKIQRLGPGSFSHLSNVSYIILQRNPLTNLHPGTFDNLSTLKLLDLSSTQFEEFPNLIGLDSLKDLILTSNPNVGQSLAPLGSEKSLSPPGSGPQRRIANLPGLTELKLGNTSLQELPLLENLPNLTKVSLQRGEILSTPPHIFGNLPALKTIDLSRNKIAEIGEFRTTGLVELDLSFNKLTKVDRSLLRHLGSLIKLSLAHNLISFVDPSAFESQSSLEEIDLSYNQISFPSSNPFAQSPLRSGLRLKVINLESNQIDSFSQDWSILFSNLRVLNLRKNKIPELTANDLNFVSFDLSLDLRENAIETVNLEGARIYISFLLDDPDTRRMTVFLDGNPLYCDCRLLQLKQFAIPAIRFQMSHLNCVNGSFPDVIRRKFVEVAEDELICPISASCPKGCFCWNRPSDKTILMNCRGQDHSTPEVIPNVTLIQPKSSQVELELSQAGISDISSEDAKRITSRIRRVDLSGNELHSLTFLDQLPQDNNLTSFSLADNPLPCTDCELHRTLFGRFKQVENLRNLTCLSEDSSISSLQEIYKTLGCDSGLSGPIQALIICLSILVALLLVFVAIWIRHGWAIRAYLYSKGLGCLFLDTSEYDDEEEEGNEKVYDAFVSYSHLDEEWVLEELVDRIEEKEGFKLCLHYRDWTPGDWIPDQIVRSVDKSRRTIVVLSKNFVESIWSRLEFKAAHSQALNEKGNRLILILKGDDLTDSDIQDEDLRVYMKMNTYLKWGDPWFWHKLKYALPHRKSQGESPKVLPIMLNPKFAREKAIRLDKLRTQIENSAA